jgi:hypothetical protein
MWQQIVQGHPWNNPGKILFYFILYSLDYVVVEDLFRQRGGWGCAPSHFKKNAVEEWWAIRLVLEEGQDGDVPLLFFFKCLGVCGGINLFISTLL